MVSPFQNHPLLNLYKRFTPKKLFLENTYFSIVKLHAELTVGIMSCRVMSCHVMLCHVVSCLVLCCLLTILCKPQLLIQAEKVTFCCIMEEMEK